MNYAYSFDTWDVVAALDGDDHNDRNGTSRQTNDAWGKNWAGCTLAKAREYAQHGWAEGAAEIGGRDPQFRVDDVPSFEYGLADEGAEPDVAAYLAGEEACMGDMRRVPMPKPVVRMGVDMAVSSNVTSDQMLRVGRAVFACVERLRAMGYPTAVDVVFSVRNHTGDNLTLKLEVQAADQPVHAGMMAFYVANPGSLRRACFALLETLPANVREQFGFKTSGGYGVPLVSHMKAEYDEWAPSANVGEAAVADWVADVMSRRSA